MAGHIKKETLTAGIAHINVGPQGTPFDVHLELLCDCSPYFDAIYKDRAESSTEDPVSLPDVDPDVFAKVVSWMYTGAFSPDLELYNQVIFLMKLWVLAGTFEIPILQNTAFSACEKKIERNKDAVICAATISFIYAQTASGSLPRQLAVDTWARRATAVKYARHKDNFPREFLEDLCGKFISKADHTVAPGQADIPLFPKFFAQGLKRDKSAGEPPTLATPEQMQNRKIKSPSPHFSGSSPASGADRTTLEPVFAARAGEVKDGGVEDA